MKKIVLALISIFIFSFCACKNDSKDLSYINISINPEIEIVCDSNGFVVAINGTNDDGKMLIQDEEIVGMNIEKACEIIIKLTKDTGFTASSTVNNEAKEFRVSISASSVDLRKEIQTKVESTINHTIESLHLDAKYTYVQEKTKDFFEDLVLAYDPTLTKEEVQEMSYQELMLKVKDATIEKAQFVTVALQDYYQELKAYQFKLKYKQELANSLGEDYQELKTQYVELLSSLSNKINELKAKEIEYFENEDSSYNKALKAYNEAKDKVIGLELEVTVAINKGQATSNIVINLNTAKLLLTSAETALDLSKKVINDAFDIINASLELILNELTKLEEKFPESIDFEEKLTNVELWLNNSKDELFRLFEETFSKERIEEITAEIRTRKEALKETVIKNN